MRPITIFGTNIHTHIYYIFRQDSFDIAFVRKFIQWLVHAAGPGHTRCWLYIGCSSTIAQIGLQPILAAFVVVGHKQLPRCSLWRTRTVKPPFDLRDPFHDDWRWQPTIRSSLFASLRSVKYIESVALRSIHAVIDMQMTNFLRQKTCLRVSQS